jgi:hypothetical protein
VTATPSSGDGDAGFRAATVGPRAAATKALGVDPDSRGMVSVDAHLRELASLADETLDERTGSSPEDHEYREALEAMRALGGESAADQLAEELRRSIRKSETLPQEQSVRSLGRDICDDERLEIPDDSWLAR